MCINLVCFNLKFLILFHVFSLRLDVSFGEISEHIQLDEELQHCLQKLHHHLQFRVWTALPLEGCMQNRGQNGWKLMNVEGAEFHDFGQCSWQV